MEVISIAQAPDYATTIHEAHIRRELISVGDTVIHDASHPDVDVPASTQIEAAEAALFRLAETDQSGSGLRGFDTIIAASINQADIARKSDGHLSGTSTGLTDLNNLLGGLHRSDLSDHSCRTPGNGQDGAGDQYGFSHRNDDPYRRNGSACRLFLAGNGSRTARNTNSE